MLEFLLFALFSTETTKSFALPGYNDLPGVEVMDPSRIPQQKPGSIAPKLFENPETALFSIDLGSGKKLFTKDQHRPQYIAAITKLMTALIIVQEHALDESVTITREATDAVGAQIDLYEYERLSVGTLLEAIMIPSANDAAVALAIHNAGSEAAFTEKMNAKAKELGLYSAKFYNATGLDVYPAKDSLEVVKGNQMSAYDVSRLSQIVWNQPFLRQAAQKELFSGSSIDEEFYHEKPTTNQLMGTFLNVKGLKTGYTQLAGQCLVAIGENEFGDEVLTVVLGSEDRFTETKILLSWIYDAFEW